MDTDGGSKDARSDFIRQLKAYSQRARGGLPLELPDSSLLSDQQLAQLSLEIAAVARRTPTLEVDSLVGSPWQTRVWQALCTVPFGETRTYSEVAAALGCAAASRAVASACAANSCAVLIPCHRIISKNGSMAGYRWGLRWKEALLWAERSLVS